MNAYFQKYQALGNDMVVIDPATFDYPLMPATARLICDRHFGLGADGICYGPLPNAAKPRTMRFFNPDGSESAKSGNGLRIFARYVWEQGYAGTDVAPWPMPTFEIGIGSERVQVEIMDQTAHTIALTMGGLSFHSRAIPVAGPAREVVEEEVIIAGTKYRITAVTIGNPHCVIFTGTISQTTCCTVGPCIETDTFFPDRTNVQFVEVLDRHTIRIEIWERGAGYTLASGTSACAAAGAAIRTGRCDSPVAVSMPGGTARVAVDEARQVTLTGTVEGVCRGIFAAELVAKF